MKAGAQKGNKEPKEGRPVFIQGARCDGDRGGLHFF